jgi:hypothetical protein
MTDFQQTSNIMNPNWDIFSETDMDMSTVEKEWVQYQEQNVTGTTTMSKYELETRDRDAFLLLHEGYLEVKARVTLADGVTALSTNNKVALQNCALSMFQSAEYLIEDQRIEYQDHPGVGFLIKNIVDFSKQYGESIASNEGFYLDTDSGATTPFCNLRFFNNTGVKAGTELFMRANATPNIAVFYPGTSTSTWEVDDDVVARIGDYNSPYQVEFRALNTLVADGLNTAQVVRTLSLGAGGVLRLSYDGTNVDKDNYFAQAYVMHNGVQLTDVKFYKNVANVQSRIFPTQNGVSDNANPNPTPIDYAGIAANDIVFGAANFDGAYNKGFYKRHLQAIKGSANTEQMMFWIPLKHIFLFCRAYNKVTRGIRHRIVLNKYSNARDVLFKAGNYPDMNLNIEGISMWVPRLKPSLEILRMVESKLASNDTYQVHFTDLTTFRTNNITAAKGIQQTIQLATTTKKIIRCWVAFQKASRVNGDQSTNKRVFDHLLCQAIQVRLNGQIFPLFEYKFDVQDDNWKHYNRAYTALMNAGFKMHSEEDGSLITLESFKDLYPIFYFDLTAQPEDLYKSAKYSELEIRFTLGLDQNHYAYVCYESERMLTIKGISGSMAIQL